MLNNLPEEILYQILNQVYLFDAAEQVKLKKSLLRTPNLLCLTRICKSVRQQALTVFAIQNLRKISLTSFRDIEFLVSFLRSNNWIQQRFSNITESISFNWSHSCDSECDGNQQIYEQERHEFGEDSDEEGKKLFDPRFPPYKVFSGEASRAIENMRADKANEIFLIRDEDDLSSALLELIKYRPSISEYSHNLSMLDLNQKLCRHLEQNCRRLRKVVLKGNLAQYYHVRSLDSQIPSLESLEELDIHRIWLNRYSSKTVHLTEGQFARDTSIFGFSFVDRKAKILSAPFDNSNMVAIWALQAIREAIMNGGLQVIIFPMWHGILLDLRLLPLFLSADFVIPKLQDRYWYGPDFTNNVAIPSLLTTLVHRSCRRFLKEVLHNGQDLEPSDVKWKLQLEKDVKNTLEAVRKEDFLSHQNTREEEWNKAVDWKGEMKRFLDFQLPLILREIENQLEVIKNCLKAFGE